MRRRVPVPVLRPEIDLCVDTGVVLDEGAPVLVMADDGGVGAARRPVWSSAASTC